MAQSFAASRAGSRAEFGRELAFVALSELAVLAERKLTGDEQKISGADERTIIGGRRRRLGKNDAELLEALCGFAHRGATLLEFRGRTSAWAERRRQGLKRGRRGFPRVCRSLAEGKLVFACRDA